MSFVPSLTTTQYKDENKGYVLSYVQTFRDLTNKNGWEKVACNVGPLPFLNLYKTKHIVG